MRAASNWRGNKFPDGVKTAQRAVGTRPDDKWGPKSRAGHDDTVAAIQKVLGVTVDGIWGPDTDRAYLALRSDKKR
ncbi:hypothetical protein [Isoptericola aurantiacus]|uniref:hypothetical protein n=1 Tax=Isoptericola aurantiacus TaxID=3377839 RepID=UPI00383B9B21